MHTSTYKGKRVRIQLKDGTVFVDKFMDKKSAYIIFEERGRVEISNIKSFGIFKDK